VRQPHIRLPCTPVELARFARYRVRRRERIGEAADKARSAAATRKTLELHRAEINERRRARVQRNAGRRKKAKPTAWAGGLSIITEKEIRLDTTVWKGRQTRYQIEIERLASEILKGRATVEAAHQRIGELEMLREAAHDRHNRRANRETPNPA
jgi:hypothetical protein